jgi:hypothetical protein
VINAQLRGIDTKEEMEEEEEEPELPVAGNYERGGGAGCVEQSRVLWRQ